MSDLLNQINQQQQAAKTATSSTDTVSGTSVDTSTAGTTSTTTTNTVTGDGTSTVDSTSSTETKPKSGVESRDKESLYDEIRELRAENKARRLQLEEERNKISSEFEAKFQQYEEKMQTALSAKEELEALKAKEADKKRSIEERLTHREARLAEMEAERNAMAAKWQAELEAKEAELLELRTQQEAQKQVYQERISEELNKIPESRRKFAEMMIKGHNDPRDAWTALSEAKADGLFEDKVTNVVHTTPGADASRMTKERQEAIKHGERSNLSSTQLIREGLKNVNQQGKLI